MKSFDFDQSVSLLTEGLNSTIKEHFATLGVPIDMDRSPLNEDALKQIVIDLHLYGAEVFPTM